tara:strand:- start:4486 stop:6426 length:1941 start_codon:yes stop_codon:yes gene_type:complete
MKKFTLFLLFVLIWLPLAAQNDLIAPSLTKAELIEFLQANYSVTNPLGYSGARDQMYGSTSIDNTDGTLTGVYTGYKIEVAQNTNTARSESFSKGINTEHTWPQGLFGSDEPMRGDIHHLFPTRIEANSARNNYPFDEISDQQTTTWFFEDQTQSSIPDTNIDSYSEYLSGTSFEPREDHKGNVARAIFYFWAIYQNTNDVSDDAAFFNGMKDVLLTWHDADPVDSAEVARSIGAEQAQGNRNPFIHDTTLVRRAFFNGDIVQPDPVPNPVSGKITSIEEATFDLTFVYEEKERTVKFNFTNSLSAKDTSGNDFNLTDYEVIEEAEVNWNEGESESELIAISLKAIDFGTVVIDPDTVITGPSASTNALIITGIMDGTLSGGTPKTVELFATEDIPDLGVFGVGSANNGGPSEGAELILSGSLAKGEFTYIATEEVNFNTWFGFTPKFVDNAVAINGDDAIELFYDTTKAFSGNEAIVDVFGVVGEDGSGKAWEYTDGWAYRVNFTGPDSTIFNSSNWLFSGVDELEGESSNSTAANPFPVGTYTYEVGTFIDAKDEQPKGFTLFQNYPNPFNPSTSISYLISKSGFVSLKVFDITGREVAILEQNQKSPGRHSVLFDATGLSSGVYIYQLKVGDELRSSKMLLVK